MDCTSAGEFEGFCPIEHQNVDSIAYTLTMNSSNEEKPVKLLALGKFLIVLACEHIF